jgi:hypothetical protein
MKMGLMGLAVAGALVAATPAAAGYRFATIDGPGTATIGTVVTSINDSGTATGYYVTADPTVPAGALGDYTAFTVNADGSGFTTFSRPGYAQTGAAGINNAGDITGVSITAAGTGNGFVRSGATGAYTDIVPTFAGSYYSEAIGINNSGAVTGYYVTDPAATVATLSQYAHGYVEVGGTYIPVDIDPSIGYGTQVTSINDFGLVTGSFLGNGDGYTHPFIGTLDPTTLAVQIIAFPFDPYGAPSSTIGNITDNLLTTYDSLYPEPISPTGFVALSSVIDVANGGALPVEVPGAFFTDAFGVNQIGQVTGYYLDDTGLHGFIGTAVPEPASWALMIAGFGLVGGALRRRSMVAAKG